MISRSWPIDLFYIAKSMNSNRCVVRRHLDGYDSTQGRHPTVGLYDYQLFPHEFTGTFGRRGGIRTHDFSVPGRAR